MDLYEALHKMRELSKAGRSFAFSFMSYNSAEGRSDGIVQVLHGRLRAREMEQHHKDADFVEAYTDLDTMQPRRFYQPLLMTFNGEKVTLQ